MPIHDIQSSFGGGEVSPDLQARVDLAKYKTSLKTLRNFIPGPHGSAYNRPGTYFVADTKTDASISRLVPFVPSSTDAYVLEFGDSYIRFYKNGGQILLAGVPYEVTTPYAAADLATLAFTRSADTLYIVHKDYAPMTLQRTSDNSWTLATYVFKNGPFMLGNADTTKIVTQGSDFSGTFISTNFNFFQTGHAGAQMQVTQNVDGSLLHGSATATGVITYTTEAPAGGVTDGEIIGSIKCGGTWRLRTHGTWTGKVALQKSDDNGVTWQTIQYFVSQADVNFDTFGTEELSLSNGNPILLRANVISYTSGTVTVDLSSDPYEVFSTIHLTTYSSATKMYIDSTDPVFQPTSLWAEGSWSTYRGWPSAINFFQDRLVFAATPFEPQTAWFTKTSNYVDFGRSIPLVDSDGITINLQSRQVSPVINITSSLNTCLFFTGTSYWTVTSDSGGSITPTTVFAKIQETRGTNSVVPVTIGNRLIFVASRGNTVRDIQYQYLQDQYQSENISISSDHLFRDFTIVDMAYAETPDSILWLVRSDGALLSCTYLREQEVLSWARHDTVGSFEAICSIPGDGVDEVWFIVLRGSKRYIERMLLRTISTDPSDQYFVDCGIVYDGAATATLSGYDHLNGMTVAIQANGFVKPQQAISGGLVNVPAGTTKAAVGLPFICDIETLNPEIPMRDGTSQGRKYQINRCVLRFLNTVGGYIGSDLNTLDAIPFDPADDDDDPTPLFTGFIACPIPPSDDEYGHVAYRQLDPMPSTVLSILPLVGQGDQV